MVDFRIDSWEEYAVNEKPQIGKVHTKVLAVKDYLRKHSLEVQLSEALQGVLRDRPDNPQKYIAARLLSLGDGKLPEQLPCFSQLKSYDVISATPTTPRNAPSAMALDLQQWGCNPTAPSISRLQWPKSSTAVALKPASPVPLPQAAESFRAYYNKHVKTLAKVPTAAIYVRFLCQEDAQPDAAAAAEEELEVKMPFHLKPSVGTWMGLKKQRPSCTTQPEEKAVLASTVSSKPSLKPEFPFRLAPSVGTWFMPKRPRVAITAPAAQTSRPEAALAPVVAAPQVVSDFKLAPSVGTWMMRKTAVVALVPSALPAKAAVEGLPAKDFRLKPSVGTWYAKAVKPSIKALATAAALSPASTATDVAVPTVAAEPWKMRPSVGTWLAAPRPVSRIAPIEALEPKAAAVRIADEELAAEAKPDFRRFPPSSGHNKVMLRTQTLYGATHVGLHLPGVRIF